MSTKTSSSPKQTGFWESIFISVVISLGAFFLFHYFFAPQSQSVNPPILIVDYAELVGDLPVDDVASDVAMIQIGEVIAQFQAAGFLIIDAQNVISAPYNLYLTKEMLNE